jgi:hypothetical protein
MTLCSYVIRIDTGFAPNPFWGYCTLAACTPNHMGVRLAPGDWIMATTPAAQGSRLLYAMRVLEMLGFDQYFRDSRFTEKKPDLNAGWPAISGDNMYFREPSGAWGRLPTVHHLEPGLFEKDTRHGIVYISDYFFYFGANAVTIPTEFRSLVWLRQGCKRFRNDPTAHQFVEWLTTNYAPGRHGEPTHRNRVPGRGRTASPCLLPAAGRQSTNGQVAPAPGSGVTDHVASNRTLPARSSVRCDRLA